MSEIPIEYQKPIYTKKYCFEGHETMEAEIRLLKQRVEVLEATVARQQDKVNSTV